MSYAINIYIRQLPEGRVPSLAPSHQYDVRLM
jgi:hypothetical protein